LLLPLNTSLNVTKSLFDHEKLIAYRRSLQFIASGGNGKKGGEKKAKDLEGGAKARERSNEQEKGRRRIVGQKS